MALLVAAKLYVAYGNNRVGANASAIAAIGSIGVWARSAASAITITAAARNRRVIMKGKYDGRRCEVSENLQEM